MYNFQSFSPFICMYVWFFSQFVCQSISPSVGLYVCMSVFSSVCLLVVIQTVRQLKQL